MLLLLLLHYFWEIYFGEFFFLCVCLFGSILFERLAGWSAGSCLAVWSLGHSFFFFLLFVAINLYNVTHVSDAICFCFVLFCFILFFLFYSVWTGEFEVAFDYYYYSVPSLVCMG